MTTNTTNTTNNMYLITAVWDYREIAERVRQLEDAYQRPHTADRDIVISSAIKAEEIIINNELSLVSSGKENGDEKALLSYRRRLRQLYRSVITSDNMTI